MKSESLLARTKRLLKECGDELTYQEIATGARVDLQWFAKFKQGHIKEPGVNKVERLHNFLTARAATKVPRQNGEAA